MYKIEQSDFGPWVKYEVFDEQTGNGFALVPDRGACLLNLRFQGKNILDSYQTPEELEQASGSKSALLFPFPNRLKNGNYHFAGKTYQLELNDKSGPNAIHGIGRKKAFELTDSSADATQASISCTYTDSGDHPGYPFPFSVTISFRIDNDGNFDVSMIMKNLSHQPIPAGLGWHPYFSLGHPIDEYELQLPAVERIEVDDTMIPTGKKTSYEAFARSTKIQETSFDTCFALPPKQEVASIKLTSSQEQLIYRQETGPSAWNFVQLYTPPHRKSIAIEPMTCNVDAFNNQDGLVILAPEEELGAGFSLEYQKN